MWLLESDGDVLEGKRVWLRPGKSYLFGRTHSNGKGIKVEHSTISRKHATITVDLPKAGDVTSLDARSGLKIEDLKSKHGTHVGERKLSGEATTLHSDEVSFRLGGYEETFTIKWHSVVFTFKQSNREKDKKALREKRDLLEPLDIKAIDYFDPEHTTHVVSLKRNTPQVLQGLVHAKYIVDESILKELEYITTADNLDEPESMSRLEVDFDEAWPDPLKFVPAATKEPIPRPPETFLPDNERKQVFRGYTFVMFDKKQYDGIAPAIVDGCGQAKFHELKLGEATSADIVRHMKAEFEAAENISEGSGYGVLHVRFVIGDPELEAWATRIQVESIVATGQGLVEQNEFLEAILMADARSLVKKAATQAEPSSNGQPPVVSDPVQAESNSHQSSSRTHQRRSQPQPVPQTQTSSTRRTTQNDSSHAQSPAIAEPDLEAATTDIQAVEAAARTEETPSAVPAPTGRSRRNRVRGVVSAFKGFVDDVDDTDMAVVEDSAPLEEPRKTPSPEPQENAMELDDTILNDEPTITQTPRKRPLPPDFESGEDINAKLFPAQAAAKRRRLEAGTTTQAEIEPVTQEQVPEPDVPKKGAKDKAAQQYGARMKKIREDQERIKDEELEPMHEQLEKMDFREKQNLIKVAEFEVKPRKRDQNTSQAQDPRWNDAWNGRKNFKGFRKRGQPPTVRSGPRIIIGLEPIKVPSAAEQFLASKETEADRRRAQRRLQVEDEEESEVSQDFTDANTHQEDVPAELLADGGPEVIDVDAPRTTRASDRGSAAPSRAKTVAASLKRQASNTTSGPAKKTRKLNLRMGDDDASSEEDEIPKFRFKKK